MGACVGKSNRPAVVVIKTKNKPSKQTNPDNNTAFDEYDEPQISQINQSDPQQKPESPHPVQQDLHPQEQSPPPEQRPIVQKEPEKVFVSPAHHEEKHAKDHALDDADEEEFANKFSKKESPQTHNKGNYHEQSGGFMVNLPGSQVGNQQRNDINHQENYIEEKKYESKNKDKNVRDIINNPDAMEQSMSSPGTGLKKILEKKPQDDFDAIIEDTQTHPHHTQNHQHRQSQFSTGSQENMNRGGVNKIESASPMSGVLQNRGSVTEKEKPVHHESPVKVNKEEMRMSESVEKKVESPEKIQMMRQSLEKMPWERTSVVRQEDDNEIEFFDDELEASKE